MKIILTIALLLFISSCATSKFIKGPDGTDHILISCGSVEDCYAKASEDCGGKYKIVNTSSDTNGGPDQMTTTQTKLLVKCQ